MSNTLETKTIDQLHTALVSYNSHWRRNRRILRKSNKITGSPEQFRLPVILLEALFSFILFRHIW